MTKTMKQILELGHDADKFRPDAVGTYRKFLDEIYEKVPLDTITDDDVKAFLSQSDFEDYEHSIKRLSEWLAECLLTDGRVYPVFPVWGVFGFGDLLRKVYERKSFQKREREAKSAAEFQSYLDLRRKDQEQEQAIAEHKDFVDKIIASLDSFKASLSTQKEPVFDDYPSWLQPYKPWVWCNLYGPPKGWMTAEMLAKVIVNKALAPEPIRNLLTHKVSFGAWYTPKVKYEVATPPPLRSKGHSSPKVGVPCLRWLMDTYILSIIEFWSEEGTIPDKRYGWVWDIKCTPECLGRAYNGPVFWKCQDALITPISLLALLAWGKAELPGVEVLKRNSPWTVYAVEGFPSEITLHDDFIKFVRDMTKKTPLDKSLFSRGMCDEETALLVKAKLEKLQKPETPAAFIGIANGPESKTGNDYEMLVNALGKLGYNNAEATKTAKYVCQKSPHETLVDKIKIAVQYLSK